MLSFFFYIYERTFLRSSSEKKVNFQYVLGFETNNSLLNRVYKYNIYMITKICAIVLCWYTVGIHIYVTG